MIKSKQVSSVASSVSISSSCANVESATNSRTTALLALKPRGQHSYTTYRHIKRSLPRQSRTRTPTSGLAFSTVQFLYVCGDSSLLTCQNIRLTLIVGCATSLRRSSKPQRHGSRDHTKVERSPVWQMARLHVCICCNYCMFGLVKPVLVVLFNEPILVTLLARESAKVDTSSDSQRRLQPLQVLPHHCRTFRAHRPHFSSTDLKSPQVVQ